jgi:hypothetical protein
MAMRICFVNFWPGAFTSANGAYFLPYAFTQAFDTVQFTEDVSSADVVVSSVFGRQPTPREKTIQYIGENTRPNFALHRFALSFDFDTYGGRNFRLPLWWWRLDWPGFGEIWRRRPVPTGEIGHGFEDLIPIDALLRPRPICGLAARKFCVVIASNPEPLRVNLLLALQGLGEVAKYGIMFGNPLLRSKFDVLSGFRFCLCPENGIYPGYHTEKLVDAWFGGCVPLYSGDRLLCRDFNASALVNYQDYLDTYRFIEHVKHLDSNAEAFAEIYSRPLLTERPSLTPLIEFLRRAVTEIRRTGSV